MNYSPTDFQITMLYKGVLAPWEQRFATQKANWEIETLKASAIGLHVEFDSVELTQVEAKLNERIEQGSRNFFVFVRHSSQGRDIFRHLRNAIAHAGVTRHQEDNEPNPSLRFKSPNPSKKSVAMAGQLEELHLSIFIAALTKMAAEAGQQTEA